MFVALTHFIVGKELTMVLKARPIKFPLLSTLLLHLRTHIYKMFSVHLLSLCIHLLLPLQGLKDLCVPLFFFQPLLH